MGEGDDRMGDDRRETEVESLRREVRRLRVRVTALEAALEADASSSGARRGPAGESGERRGRGDENRAIEEPVERATGRTSRQRLDEQRADLQALRAAVESLSAQVVALRSSVEDDR